MHAARRIATQVRSNAVRQQPQATIRQFSSSALRLSSAEGAVQEVNPRWFTDLRGRIKAFIAANPQGKDVDKLTAHLAELDNHWLELSAGREGYLTEDRWKGLNKFGVAWGDMDSMVSHVNNIMYNRYAESGRVNWITSFAEYAPAKQRQEWRDTMSPRGIGLILKSIKTDYKLPVEYPDKITVIHKLAQMPDYNSTSLFLDAVIYSETHKRVAARCFEDVAIYDYKKRTLANLRPYMVDELQKIYHLQEKNRADTEKRVKQLYEDVQKMEDAQ